MNGIVLHCLLSDGYSEDESRRAAASADEFIMNYCNISAVPSELHNTEIAVARRIAEASAGGNSASRGNVKSVTVGDAGVVFGERFSADYSALEKEFGAVLRRFRKVGFT